MEMPLSEITVRSLVFGNNGGPDTLYVLAGFGGIALERPKVYFDEKSGKTFRFVCNEVMEACFVGRYSGYAKYEEIRTATMVAVH